MEVREISEDRFIECLTADFPNFKVTKTNLSHPTSQFVISFYGLMLRHIIELNDPDEIWYLTEDQRSYMNSCHPEAATFGQHVWANNLHAAVKYVFNQLSENGREFVYSDILFPENTPRRSFVFMALMLNFYWYSNDFAVDLDNDMTACLEEVRLIQNLKADKEKLADQLREIEDQRFQYGESYKDIKKALKKCAESNEEIENVMKELLSKEDLVKKDLEKVEEEEQKLQETLTKYQNEIKYLESLIVSNPNQVVDIHQKHLARKDDCVKKIKILEEQAKTASSKLQQSNTVLELQQKLNSFLKDDKFLPEIPGEHKGFHNIFENINILTEKLKKVLDEESVFQNKITEAEEILPKLKSQYSELELQHEEISLTAKDKTTHIVNFIDNQQKNHYQLFLKMKEDKEEMEEFVESSVEMNAKCDEAEEKIKVFDSENKTRFANYTEDVANALNSIQSFFDQD